MKTNNSIKKSLLNANTKTPPAFLCYLVPFVFLGGYLIYLILNNEMRAPNNYYLIHFLYTYDHGFVARGFVGEVLSWFFETVSDELIKNVLTAFSALLMISAVLCIGKALSKVRDDKHRFWIVAVVAVVICLLPASFRLYYTDIKSDKLLWAITLFAVLLANKKHGVWLVPVLCVIATLVNPVFLFCSMILISIILLQEFYSKGFNTKNGIICAVSYVSMIALGVFAIISEKQLGFSTPAEMVDFYFSRYAGVLSEDLYNGFLTDALFDYFDPANVVLTKAYQLIFEEWGKGSVCVADFIFLCIPTYTVTVIFWKNCIKQEENKFQKFIFFLCAISPIVIVPAIILSWDSSKYFYNNLIVQLSLLIYFVVQNNNTVMTVIRNACDFLRNHIIIAVNMLFYFASFVIV